MSELETATKPRDRKIWPSLPGAAATHAISETVKSRAGMTLVITRDSQEAERVHNELRFFLGDSHNILHLPDWETLIYDSFSPHQDIISARLGVLNQLSTMDDGIVVIPATTLVQRMAPSDFILGSSLLLKTGEKFDITQMRRKLQGAAYRAVDTVFDHGEFAVRGAIMDIFPMGTHQPYRIDLFDDEIDTLRTFDTETQMSIEQVDQISLLPAREFPLNDEAIKAFQDRWFLTFHGDPRSCPTYRDISQGISPPGIEYYLPLFFDSTSTLFDYLPEETLVFTQDIGETLDAHWQETNARYENLRHDIERPILPPRDITMPPDELFALLKRYPRVDLKQPEPGLDKPEPGLVQLETDGDSTSTGDAEKAPGKSNPYRELTDLTISERSQTPLASLSDFVDSKKSRLLIITESNGRREVVDELLGKHGLKTKVVDDWQSFINGDADLAITVAPLERSLSILSPIAGESLALLTEQQLFGNRVLQRRRRDREKENFAELAIKSLTELSIGAPVVHIDHGVGRYQGLQTLAIDGQETEFLTLIYQDEATLYVPVSSLHLISRYTGSEEGLAPLHRLGAEIWQKAKRKAAEQIHDTAAELLNIYARREAKIGFSYPAPDSQYDQFAGAFPFEETPDQETAIESVVADMVAEKSMDRLICGDVGFGKTEVAMRAAFIAV
ncbi:MAG: transcription-repair coupling factor (superfamily II helicase), partial [Candidatus Azotimanducaceae bacterium]